MDKQLRNLLVKNNSLLKDVRATLLTISARLHREKEESLWCSYLNAILRSGEVEKILRDGVASSIDKSVKQKYLIIGRGIIAEGFWKGLCETVNVSSYGYSMVCLKYLMDGHANFEQFLDILNADYGFKGSRSRIASKLDDILRDNEICLKTTTLEAFYKRKQGVRFASLRITMNDFFLMMKAMKLDTQILDQNSNIDEFFAVKSCFAELTDEEMQKAENIFFEDAVMAQQAEIFGKC